MDSLKNTILKEPVKNFIKVFSSGVFAQGLSFMLAPVVARLFLPEDFGTVALFLSIISVIAVFSTFKYEQAIMLPKEDKDAINIFALVFLITFAAAIFTAIVVPFVYLFANHWFSDQKIIPWLWFIPLSLILHGITQSIIYWFNRKKLFGNIAKATLWNYIPLNASKVSTGYFNAPFNGLIFSFLVGQLLNCLYLITRFYKSSKDALKMLSVSIIKHNAKKYSVYPKYNMVHTFANNFSGSLPIFLFTWGFSPEIAGLYSFGYIFVFKPLNIISQSLLQVLSQKTIEDYNNGLNILPNIKKIVSILFRLGIAPFTLLFLFAPDIFEFLFSEKYREAGEFLKILTPWLFMVFISSSLSFIPEIFFRQKTAMFIDLAYLLLRAAALITGIWLSDVYMSLILFSAINFVIITIVLFWYLYLAKSSINLSDNSK